MTTGKVRTIAMLAGMATAAAGLGGPVVGQEAAVARDGRRKLGKKARRAKMHTNKARRVQVKKATKARAANRRREHKAARRRSR